MSVVHFKKEPYDVYIGRGPDSMWGNPFSHEANSKAEVIVPSREDAVEHYRRWLDDDTFYPEVGLYQRQHNRDRLYELTGKVLGCWCAPKSCHGDVLAELAKDPPYPISGAGAVRILKELAREARKRKIKLACIGRRAETLEPEMEALCRQIGKWIVKHWMYVASGNADGCDAAYAAGANEDHPGQVVLYLPWKSFNADTVHPKNRVRLPSDDKAYIQIVRERHPQGPYLKQAVLKLHSRNCAILSGASACIAYPSYKTGGTKFGMTLARTGGVPVLDLTQPDVMDALYELTKDL